MRDKTSLRYCGGYPVRRRFPILSECAEKRRAELNLEQRTNPCGVIRPCEFQSMSVGVVLLVEIIPDDRPAARP